MCPRCGHYNYFAPGPEERYGYRCESCGRWIAAAANGPHNINPDEPGAETGDII